MRRNVNRLVSCIRGTVFATCGRSRASRRVLWKECTDCGFWIADCGIRVRDWNPHSETVIRNSMRVLSITAGAAGMYCGRCLRDNALAAELLKQGHHVLLVPIYTPTLTDEENVSMHRVFFGGISVYLEQHVPLFRHTPRLLDRLWDSEPALKMVARRSISVNPQSLAEMTISMLRGEDGYQRKELDKLIDW